MPNNPAELQTECRRASISTMADSIVAQADRAFVEEDFDEAARLYTEVGARCLPCGSFIFAWSLIARHRAAPYVGPQGVAQRAPVRIAGSRLPEAREVRRVD